MNSLVCQSEDVCEIRWGREYSEQFSGSNGERQGGILSAYLFNIYVDDLSTSCNACRVGCYLNDVIVNHIMYADGLVLMAPSVTAIGLSKLLSVCEGLGTVTMLSITLRRVVG